MKYRQENLLQKLQQMDQTIEAHPELSAFVGTTAHKGLTGSIADLSTYAASQQAGAIATQGETVRARSLREGLRRIHLQPIVAAARICAAHNPALASLAMPPSRMRTPALLAMTLGIIETAHTHEAELVAAGLPSTFLADVDAAVARLRTSLDDRARHGSRRTGATEGLGLTTRRAREVIKIVDAQVRVLIGENGALLAEWRSATRIGRKPGVPAGSSRTDTPVSPTPIVAAPAA